MKGKRRGNIKTGFFCAEWSRSFIVLALDLGNIVGNQSISNNVEDRTDHHQTLGEKKIIHLKKILKVLTGA